MTFWHFWHLKLFSNGEESLLHRHSPQIDVFDAEQSEVLQCERLQAVSSHAQLLHGGELLQNLGHVGELVEGKAYVAQPLKGAQLFGQLRQTVAIQEERLKAARGRDKVR